MRVSKNSEPRKVAGAIAGKVREWGDDSISLEMIGRDAIYQGVKSVFIANSLLKKDDVSIAISLEFKDDDVDGETKTVIVFNIEVKNKKESQGSDALC